MSLHELDGFAADLKTVRTRFNQLIARIDLRVKALIDASPERKQHFARLRTIYMIARSCDSIVPNPRNDSLEGAEARGTAFISRSLDRLRRHARRAGIEWRMRIVFEGELNGLRDIGPGNLRHQGERKIDPRCNATAGESVPVANNAFFHRNRAHAWQQMVIRPMRRRLLPPQKARGAEDERSRADGPVKFLGIWYLGALAWAHRHPLCSGRRGNDES